MNPTVSDLVLDPVCGMMVDPKRSVSFTHGGEAWYFCCGNCLAKFRSDPATYSAKVQDANKAKDPVCGMTVEKDRAAGQS